MDGIYNCTGHDIRIPNVESSSGLYLFDEQGKQYMDLESGIWCTSLGHNHPRIKSLIKKQINAVMHTGFCYSNHVLQEAAKAIRSITGFNEGKCVFLCSGSEAIELARQITMHVTKRKRSMTLHDSYLGSYLSVIDRSDKWYVFDWQKCVHCPDQEKCSPDCDEMRKIPGDVSAFIFEPGSSSGFVRFPPKSLIRNIIDQVRAHGGKIIANEVTTGIGRTGKWFGYQHYGIKPDVVAIGKGIGNGYPVSVTAINSQTIEELEESTFKYNQSHQNDPLGAAIVNEVIKIINDDELIEKAEINGARFLEMLQALKDDSSILDVRGRGLMFAIDLCDANTGDRIFNRLIDKGYIVCNRKALFRIDPPLIVKEAEFAVFVDDFNNILKSDKNSAS